MERGLTQAGGERTHAAGSHTSGVVRKEKRGTPTTRQDENAVGRKYYARQRKELPEKSAIGGGSSQNSIDRKGHPLHGLGNSPKFLPGEKKGRGIVMFDPFCRK